MVKKGILFVGQNCCTTLCCVKFSVQCVLRKPKSIEEELLYKLSDFPPHPQTFYSIKITIAISQQGGKSDWKWKDIERDKRTD